MCHGGALERSARFDPPKHCHDGGLHHEVGPSCVHYCRGAAAASLDGVLRGLMIRGGRLPSRALQRLLADHQGQLTGFVIGECGSLV
jgi:hypothetical protein